MRTPQQQLWLSLFVLFASIVCDQRKAVLAEDASSVVPPSNSSTFEAWTIAGGQEPDENAFFENCKTAMVIGDPNRDDEMDATEYVAYLNRLYRNEFLGLTYEELPSPFQILFDTLAQDEMINVAGSKPNALNVPLEQLQHLQYVCDETKLIFSEYQEHLNATAESAAPVASTSLSAAPSATTGGDASPTLSPSEEAPVAVVSSASPAVAAAAAAVSTEGPTTPPAVLPITGGAPIVSPPPTSATVTSPPPTAVAVTDTDIRITDVITIRAGFVIGNLQGQSVAELGPSLNLLQTSFAMLVDRVVSATLVHRHDPTVLDKGLAWSDLSDFQEPEEEAAAKSAIERSSEYSHCKFALEFANADKDASLTQTEYLTLIEGLSGEFFEEPVKSQFALAPQPYQDAFSRLAGHSIDGSAVPVIELPPIEALSLQQEEQLIRVCSETQKAIEQVWQSRAILNDHESHGPGVVQGWFAPVVDLFMGSGGDGGGGRRRLRLQSRFLLRQQQLRVVGVRPDSAILYTAEDSECPNNAPAGSNCQTVLAAYQLELTRVVPEEEAAYFTEAALAQAKAHLTHRYQELTRAEIQNGDLQRIVASEVALADPSSQSSTTTPTATVLGYSDTWKEQEGVISTAPPSMAFTNDTTNDEEPPTFVASTPWFDVELPQLAVTWIAIGAAVLGLVLIIILCCCCCRRRRKRRDASVAGRGLQSTKGTPSSSSVVSSSTDPRRRPSSFEIQHQGSATGPPSKRNILNPLSPTRAGAGSRRKLASARNVDAPAAPRNMSISNESTFDVEDQSIAIQQNNTSSSSFHVGNLPPPPEGRRTPQRQNSGGIQPTASRRASEIETFFEQSSDWVESFKPKRSPKRGLARDGATSVEQQAMRNLPAAPDLSQTISNNESMDSSAGHVAAVSTHSRHSESMMTRESFHSQATLKASPSLPRGQEAPPPPPPPVPESPASAASPSKASPPPPPVRPSLVRGDVPVTPSEDTSYYSRSNCYLYTAPAPPPPPVPEQSLPVDFEDFATLELASTAGEKAEQVKYDETKVLTGNESAHWQDVEPLRQQPRPPPPPPEEFFYEDESFHGDNHGNGSGNGSGSNDGDVEYVFDDEVGTRPRAAGPGFDEVRPSAALLATPVASASALRDRVEDDQYQQQMRNKVESLVQAVLDRFEGREDELIASLQNMVLNSSSHHGSVGSQAWSAASTTASERERIEELVRQVMLGAASSDSSSSISSGSGQKSSLEAMLQQLQQQ